jgi:hypothetical protein
MYYRPTNQLLRLRGEIEHKWREATQRSIDLYLQAKEDADISTVAEINERFANVLADLESPLQTPGLYDDLIAMTA